MSEKINSNRVVLKGIANWPNLAQPKGINGSPAKYSLCLIIPKDDIETLNKYQAALEAAYALGEKKLATGKSMPKLSAIRCPLHDGDVEKLGQEAYANSYYLNASGRERPDVVDRDREAIDPAEVYSGCTVNVSVTLYAYNAGGVSKGIAAGLNGVQLVKKGERFGFSQRARDDFQVLPDEDDEDDLPF